MHYFYGRRTLRPLELCTFDSSFEEGWQQGGAGDDEAAGETDEHADAEASRKREKRAAVGSLPVASMGLILAGISIRDLRARRRQLWPCEAYSFM